MEGVSGGRNGKTLLPPLGVGLDGPRPGKAEEPGRVSEGRWEKVSVRRSVGWP